MSRTYIGTLLLIEKVSSKILTFLRKTFCSPFFFKSMFWGKCPKPLIFKPYIQFCFWYGELPMQFLLLSNFSPLLDWNRSQYTISEEKCICCAVCYLRVQHFFQKLFLQKKREERKKVEAQGFDLVAYLKWYFPLNPIHYSCFWLTSEGHKILLNHNDEFYVLKIRPHYLEGV